MKAPLRPIYIPKALREQALRALFAVVLVSVSCVSARAQEQLYDPEAVAAAQLEEAVARFLRLWAPVALASERYTE